MNDNLITVGARAGFAAVHQIADRLNDIDFPIELALPYRYSWWKDAVLKCDEMFEALKKAKAAVATVHATQAKISEHDFLVWG